MTSIFRGVIPALMTEMKQDGALDHQATSRHIESCLAGLGREQRQAVALVIYRGLSHAEIAQQAGVPLSTAKAWVRRGLQHLKDAVDSVDSQQAARRANAG